MSNLNLTNVILLVFYLSLAVQVFFLLRYFLPFVLFFKEKKKAFPPPPVTLIVAAHNERDNLAKLLPALLAQTHPDFEILVANDRSTDGTDEILKKYADTVKSVQIDNTPTGIHPKKYALTQAIALAKNELLLFTDADCLPRSDSWAREMSMHLNEKKEIVLGFGGFALGNGPLHALQQYETLYTALQYFSFAAAGEPYMGVGRNLAYRKELFNRAGGFGDHAHVMGGDDDLLVGRMAKSENVAIAFHPNSQTVSGHKKTWGEWWHQKRRHLSVSQHYEPGIKWRLGLLHLSQLGIYLSFFFLVLFNVCSPQIITLFLMRVFSISVLLGLLASRLKIKSAWYVFPILDATYIIYLAFTGIVANLFKISKWK